MFVQLLRLKRPGRLFSRLSLLQRFAITGLMAFLLIGLGTSFVLSSAIRASSLKAAQTAAVEDLQRRLINQLSPAALQNPMRGRPLRKFDWLVRHDVLNSQVVEVKVWNPQGTVVYSTDKSSIGMRLPLGYALWEALNGHDSSNVSNLQAVESLADRGFGSLLQVYIPIRFTRQGGGVGGAFEIYERYAPIAAQIDQLDRMTYAIVGGGLFLLYVLLFGIVRAGSDTISRQQMELRTHAESLERSYRETMTSLAAAVDARDSQTELHSERVTDLAIRLAHHVGLPDAQVKALQQGSLLHDIGKIGVPDAVLLKPGPLTDAEWQVMRRHPVTGHEMIREVTFLRDALPVVRYHHERWDGGGYPDGLASDAIPIEARIFSIADAFDAMTSDRPYRRGTSTEEALRRIEQSAGTHFDPVLALMFVGMMSRGDADDHQAQEESAVDAQIDELPVPKRITEKTSGRAA